MDEFGFEPDYWRRITVPEFFEWHRLAAKRAVEAGNRARRAEFERQKSGLAKGGA